MDSKRRVPIIAFTVVLALHAGATAGDVGVGDWDGVRALLCPEGSDRDHQGRDRHKDFHARRPRSHSTSRRTGMP